jgi:DsbE subfamily thiol:disulfide oxidoreductase
MKYFPLTMFLLICAALAFGLAEKRQPNAFVSKMIGQKPDVVTLPLLGGGKMLAIPEEGKVTVLNIFASWCESCQVEHRALTSVTGKLSIIGLAWKDTPEKIKAWLTTHGNPYQQVLLDEKGQSTLPLALSGVPETFVFDKNGVIAYNKKAPVTEEELRDVILPLVERLQHE